MEPAKKTSDWKEFTAPDGRKYYYNSATKVSSWTMPDELKKGSDTPSAIKASPAAHGTPSVQVRTSSHCSAMLCCIRRQPQEPGRDSGLMACLCSLAWVAG